MSARGGLAYGASYAGVRASCFWLKLPYILKLLAPSLKLLTLYAAQLI